MKCNMELPKYYVIKRDLDNPLWKKYISWINELNDNQNFLWSVRAYYWFDWSYWANWFSCENNIEDFLNNPTLITLEEWNECINLKWLKVWDICRIISDSNNHWVNIWTVISLKETYNVPSKYWKAFLAVWHSSVFRSCDLELITKEELKVWDLVVMSDSWKDQYDDDEYNPHNLYWEIYSIDYTYNVQWTNWITNSYNEEFIQKVNIKVWDIVKYKNWNEHYKITDIKWIKIYLSLLKNNVTYTTTIDKLELVTNDSIEHNVSDLLKSAHEKIEDIKIKSTYVDALTKKWYIYILSNWKYRLLYNEWDMCIDVISNNPYNFSLDILIKAYEQLNKEPILYTNNNNMKTEMNKILVEEFVTSKTNRKTLKDMNTFINSNVDLLQRVSNRLDQVWNKLQSIWFDLDKAMDRSDIEEVQILMSEFPEVKEFITNFISTEIRDTVDIKVTEKFDVQKFFNN